jgi:tripartite-type tricarboxylate transporter receptor subunit TctC
VRALLAALLLLSACAPGDYPNGPILLVCPWAPGGGSDRIARQVGALLEQELKVPVNVVNATGGDGVTGHTQGALARPDGYTLTLVTVELNMLHWRGLTSVSPKDFEPGVLLNRDAAAVFVRADSPWKSLQDLETAVRAVPGKLRSSGTSRAAIWHVALAGWLEKIGLRPSDIVWVSIPGSAPSLAELAAGGVELVCCSLPEARSFMEAGKVRCLGVMSDDRHPGFRGVPTFKEQGCDWSMGGYRGVALPRGVPEPVRHRVVEALERIAKSEAWMDFMGTGGFGPACEGPERFRQVMEELDVRFGEILSRPGFKSIVKDRFGPYFFPGLLGAMIVPTLLILAIGRKRSGDPAPIRVRPIAEAAGTVIFYLLAAETLGFILAGGLLLAFLLWRAGLRRPVALALPALVMPALYGVFATLLRVPLPRGWLGW